MKHVLSVVAFILFILSLVFFIYGVVGLLHTVILPVTTGILIKFIIDMAIGVFLFSLSVMVFIGRVIVGIGSRVKKKGNF